MFEKLMKEVGRKLDIQYDLRYTVLERQVDKLKERVTELEEQLTTPEIVTTEIETEDLDLSPGDIIIENPCKLVGLQEVSTRVTRDKLIKAVELSKLDMNYTQKQIGRMVGLTPTSVGRAQRGYFAHKYGVQGLNSSPKELSQEEGINAQI